MSSSHPAPPPPPRPNCPFCGSEQTSSTGKAAVDDAYWRCHGCGQIWNPARLGYAGARYPRR